MDYDYVTINSLSAPPVKGFAQNLGVWEQRNNQDVPTLEAFYLVPGVTVYFITITDIFLEGGYEMVTLPEPDEKVDIIVNDTRYIQCKIVGGNLGSQEVVQGKSVLSGTVTYKGFKFDD